MADVIALMDSREQRNQRENDFVWLRRVFSLYFDFLCMIWKIENSWEI